VGTLPQVQALTSDLQLITGILQRQPVSCTFHLVENLQAYSICLGRLKMHDLKMTDKVAKNNGLENDKLYFL